MRHYCCEHSRAAIQSDGYVRPTSSILGKDWNVSWWTDLLIPDPIRLGLTSNIITCDRTQYAFESMPPASFIPWLTVAHNIPVGIQSSLHHDGASPDHWYLAFAPVAIQPTGVPIERQVSESGERVTP